MIEPTFEKYPDTGCEISSSCLNCPLPECIEITGRRNKYKDKRGRAIYAEFQKGKKINQIAAEFSLSRRTVQRVIRSQRRFTLMVHPEGGNSK